MKKLFIILCFVVKGFCGITLVNDSPFTLVAEVQGASGILLNQLSIQPGEQIYWVQDFRPSNLDIPGAPDVSITPYRVLWKCANGGFYSTCYVVGPGSMVKASLCSGAHFCKPKEEEKEEPQCPDCICPPCYSEQNGQTDSKAQEKTDQSSSAPTS